MRRRAALACLLLLLIRGTGTPAAAADSPGQDVIVLGMSGALSGASAGLGRELRSGMVAYFDHVNRDGGIRGYRIELKVYDDGYNPGPAIHNTLQLIERDGALALLGYVGTPTVTRVLPLLKMYEREEVLLFFPFSGAEPQRSEPYGRYAYNLRPSYREETRGLVDNLVATGRQRIAILYQADAYGRSGWQGVRTALEAHRLDVLAEATYGRGGDFEDSYAAQVDILRAAKPNAIISIASYAAAAGFIRDARDAGWDVPIANVSFANSQQLLELLNAHAQISGRRYGFNLVNSEVVPHFRDESLPAVREYLEIFGASTAHRPGYVSFEGFLNAKLMVEILRRMEGRAERREFRDVLDGMTDFDVGLEERVSFGPGRNQGLHTIYFNQVEDGRLVPLQDWSALRIDVETL